MEAEEFKKALRPERFRWGAFETSLQGAAKQIRANNAAKGFGKLPDLSDFREIASGNDVLHAQLDEIERQLKDGMDGKAIALIHGEASEILEARRRPGWETTPSEHVPEFTALVEEGADVIIRVLDLFERLGLTEQLAYCIPAKVAFNTTRPFKHGRTF
jgi:hypothetical protein